MNIECTRFAGKRLAALIAACVLLCNLAPAQDIQFTSFLATNEEQDSSYNMGKPISLLYNQTHIIIQFKDIKDSLNARYAYRLEGFDKRWHENGKHTIVNYINLFGGDYTLQVRNLNYPEHIASLPFHLDEAFWQRPWFVPMIAAYVLLIVGIVLYFIRMYRLRNQIRLQKIRNEIAADLHDDVGTALSSITFLGEMARSRFDKKPEEIRPILERIMDESKEMMQTMRGVVWVINPQNDQAEDFFEKVKSFAESVLQSKKIELKFTAKDTQHWQMGLEVQRNLFLIFKESVVNAAKHSDASHVAMTIQKEKNYVWILISDDGKGFEEDVLNEGNGLRNLKNRATQIGGDLQINSKLGQGTQVKMVIPIA
ncbi:histidine kinase [Dyadobacter sp.]|uniref:ATP-binding protein n=1 Tax=Dyadobacter sp. TaxID=1914288 RepID=UPI003264B330